MAAKKFKPGDLVVLKRDCYLAKDNDVINCDFPHYRFDEKALDTIKNHRKINFVLTKSRWRGGGNKSPTSVSKGSVAVVRNYENVYMNTHRTLYNVDVKDVPADAIKLKGRHNNGYVVNVNTSKVIVLVDGVLAWVDTVDIIETVENNDARFKNVSVEFSLKASMPNSDIKEIVKFINHKLKSISKSTGMTTTLKNLDVITHDNENITIDALGDIKEQLTKCATKTSE